MPESALVVLLVGLNALFREAGQPSVMAQGDLVVDSCARNAEKDLVLVLEVVKNYTDDILRKPLDWSQRLFYCPR